MRQTCLCPPCQLVAASVPYFVVAMNCLQDRHPGTPLPCNCWRGSEESELSGGDVFCFRCCLFFVLVVFYELILLSRSTCCFLLACSFLLFVLLLSLVPPLIRCDCLCFCVFRFSASTLCRFALMLRRFSVCPLFLWLLSACLFFAVPCFVVSAFLLLCFSAYLRLC